MTARVQQWSLAIGDLLFGWSLALPRDVTLLVLVVISVVLLAVVRRWCTGGQRLRDVRDDQRTLRRLLRTAGIDGPARSRLQATRSRVARLRLRLELPSLAVSFIPLLVILSWAEQRLTYECPRPHQRYCFTMYFPASLSQRVVHLVPHEAVDAPDGWLRRVALRTNAASPRGVAEWWITFSYAGEFPLRVRYDGRTWRHPVRVGQSTYGAPRLRQDNDLESHLSLPYFRPCGGWWPAWPVLGMGPWFGAYMLLTIVLFVGLQRLLWRS
jgi:hypothetical protein